jgi:predicted lipid-binding transport protein (Tim44 family)
MLAALLVSRWGKPALALAAVLLVLLLIGLCFWRGMVAIDGMQDRASLAAKAAADAKWQAQIALSNAAVERERADQIRASAAADKAARAEIARLSETLSDLERRNASLPNADACGLDHDRVRLLDPAH